MFVTPLAVSISSSTETNLGGLAVRKGKQTCYIIEMLSGRPKKHVDFSAEIAPYLTSTQMYSVNIRRFYASIFCINCYLHKLQSLIF